MVAPDYEKRDKDARAALASGTPPEDVEAADILMSLFHSDSGTPYTYFNASQPVQQPSDAAGFSNTQPDNVNQVFQANVAAGPTKSQPMTASPAWQSTAVAGSSSTQLDNVHRQVPQAGIAAGPSHAHQSTTINPGPPFSYGSGSFNAQPQNSSQASTHSESMSRAQARLRKLQRLNELYDPRETSPLPELVEIAPPASKRFPANTGFTDSGPAELGNKQEATESAEDASLAKKVAPWNAQDTIPFSGAGNKRQASEDLEGASPSKKAACSSGRGKITASNALNKRKASEDLEDAPPAKKTASSGARGKMPFSNAGSKKRQAPENFENAPPAKKVASSSAQDNMSFSTTRSKTKQSSADEEDAQPAKNTRAKAVAPDAQKTRQKLDRVDVACNRCRIKKTRCDGLTPCGECSKRNLECVYAGGQAVGAIKSEKKASIAGPSSTSSASKSTASKDTKITRKLAEKIGEVADERKAGTIVTKRKAKAEAINAKGNVKAGAVQDGFEVKGDKSDVEEVQDEAEVEEAQDESKAKQMKGTSAAQQRVARACDSCRVKKNRCDGETPCAPCTRRQIVCSYGASGGKMSHISNKSGGNSAAGSSRNASKRGNKGSKGSKKIASSGRSSSAGGINSTDAASSTQTPTASDLLTDYRSDSPSEADSGPENASQDLPRTKIVTFKVKREFLEKLSKN